MLRYPTHPDRPVIRRGLVFPAWFICLPNGEMDLCDTFEDALKVVDHYHRAVKLVEPCS